MNKDPRGQIYFNEDPRGEIYLNKDPLQENHLNECLQREKYLESSGTSNGTSVTISKPLNLNPKP